MHRFEDDRLLRGASRYIEDLEYSGALHAVFVRSPHAHARIIGVNTESAREHAGVRGVFTGQDFLAAGLRPAHLRPPHRPQRRHTVFLTHPSHVGNRYGSLCWRSGGDGGRNLSDSGA